MIRSRTFKGGAPTGIVNQTIKGKDLGGKEGKIFSQLVELMGGKSAVEKWGFCFGKANSNSGENKGKSMGNSKKGVDNSKE
jgi:hypothetical protein